MQPSDMLLSTDPVLHSCGEEDWVALLRHMIGEVQRHFGNAVFENIDNAVVSGGAEGLFCIDIRRLEVRSLGLIYFKGILMAECDESILINLTLFPYAGEERLVTSTGKEFGEYEFNFVPGTSREWRFVGWASDVHKEFRHRFGKE